MSDLTEKAEFLEKCVRPPMGADVELKNEPASIIPGSITYVNTSSGKKGFFPLFDKHRCPLDQINIDLTKVRPPQMLAWIRGVGLSSQEIDRRVQALVNAKVVGRA